MSDSGEKIKIMTMTGLVIWLLIGGILPSQGGCQDCEPSFVWCLEDPGQPDEWVMGVDATGTLYLKGELLPSENVDYRLMGISESDIIWKVKKNPAKTVAAVYLNPDTLLYDLAISGDLLKNADISSYWQAKDYWTIKQAGDLILALKKHHGELPDGSLLLAKGVAPRASWSDPETYVIESAENYYAWIVLDRVSDSTVSVDYSTNDGMAMDGIDYTAVSGTLVLSPGDTFGTIVVPLLNNSAIDLPSLLQITARQSPARTLLRSDRRVR